MAQPGTPFISFAYSLLPYAGPLDIHLYVHEYTSDDQSVFVLFIEDTGSIISDGLISIKSM